jgi:hypothetical protein
VKCPKCQAEMVERVTAWECPNWADDEPTCQQVPICKGCFQPHVLCGGGINEYFCDNEDCPRTPEENLRDLLNPDMHRFRIVDGGMQKRAEGVLDVVLSYVDIPYNKQAEIKQAIYDYLVSPVH